MQRKQGEGVFTLESFLLLFEFKGVLLCNFKALKEYSLNQPLTMSK